MDLRGFGQSSYIHQAKRLKDYAQNVIDLLNALKVNKAVAIGWSFGGAVCQKVCQMASQLVSKLILTCSVSHLGLQLKDAQGNLCRTSEEIRQKHSKIAAWLAMLEKGDRIAMRKIYDMVLFTKMASTSQRRKKQLSEDPFKQRNYLHLCEALINSDINIDTIKTPILVIHGSEDIALSVQQIMGTANKLGKLEVWKGHAHMIPLENTKCFIKSVKNFI